MSELISVGILAGLALWGYGCHNMARIRDTKVAPESNAPRKASERVSATWILLMGLLLLLSPKARIAFAQTATSSVFPANPTYVDAVTGVVTIPAVAGQAPVSGMVDYTIDGGPVATATVSTGSNYLNLGQLSIGSHALTFQAHAASAIVPPPAVSIPVTDQSFGFVGTYGRFHSDYTDANLFSSAGLAIDSKDTVWIADSILNKLVSFDIFGNINNIAIASLPIPIASPDGLAFDADDNLYISDRGNSHIIKYTPAGVETVLSIPGLGKPGQLMLDKVKNLLYIVDQDNERVVRYDLSAMAPSGYLFTGLTAIQSIALDPAGNVYVSDKVAGFLRDINNSVSALPVSAPIETPGGIFIDRAGLLYLTDSSINGTYRIDGQGHQTQISDFDSSHGLAEDSQGRIYFGTSTNVRTFTPAGELGVVAATTSSFSNSDQNNSLVYTMPHGQTTLTQVVSPTPPFFYDVETLSCPYIEVRGTCYFEVNFAPKVPGVHIGSIATTLPGGPTISTLLYGHATGPAPAFSPGTQTQTPSGAVLGEAVALDETGNYYVSDATGNQVYETSGGVTRPLGFTGLSFPEQLAVDGAGAVYVQDLSNRIAKLVAGNQTYPVVAGTGNALSELDTFAMDGGGQIYFAGPAAGGTSIYLYDRTGATSLIASGLVESAGLALDPYGDIYSLQVDGSLLRIDPYGRQSTLAPAGTFHNHTSLAVDASETAYVAQDGVAAITLVHPDGTTESIPVPGLIHVGGIAVNGTGSILAVDASTNNFIFVDRTHQDFNFGDVPVNTSKTFNSFFGNAGTQPFNITGLPSDSDFKQVTSADACSISGANATVAPASSCNLSYTVAPTAVGAITAYSGVSTNVSQDSDTFTVNAVRAPVAPTFQPASLSFGNVNVGATATQTLTLTNNDTSPLTLASISVTGSFSITGASTCKQTGTIAVQGSCSFTVQFAPTAAGMATSALTVQYTAGSATASLSGTGVAAPTATLTPASYAFGNVTVGASSGPVNFELTNTSSVSVTISDVSVMGSGFHLLGKAGTLAPGASTTFEVAFLPTSTGVVTGTLSAVTSAGTLTATLTGTGVAPTATLTPASYAFGNVTVGASSGPVNFQLTNTSGVSVTLSDVSVTGSGFHLLGKAGTLAPGASTTFEVAFLPTSTGVVTGTLSAVTSAGTLTATLTGTGVAPTLPPTVSPATLSFGSVAVGATSAAQTVTITNPATFPLTLTSIGLNGSGFSIQSAGTTCKTGPTIAAGASCTLSVIFSPAVAGAVSGSLTVGLPPGLAVSTLTVPLTGTGAPPTTAIDFSTGFSTSALTLNGPAVITGGALQLTSGQSAAASSAFFPNPAVTTTFATDFTFQLLDPATEGITFTIQGDGQAAVGSNGGGLGYQGIPKSIALKFDLRDTAGEGDDSTGIYVDGAAPTVPATSLADSGIDLHSGDVFALHIAYDGTTEFITLTDTVTNASWTTQAAENIPSIVGGNSAYFGFTAGTGAVSPDVVAANSQAKSQTKSLTGASAKPMDASATAASTTAASVISWKYNVAITPATLAPTALNFGNVTVGSTSSVQTAELIDTGTAQFQVSSITPSDPAIVVHSSYCARPVTPGTSCKLEVTLAPSAGPFSGTVVINYYLGDGTLPGENFTGTLAITGTGVVPSVTLTPASADFGSSLTSSPKTFTLTNSSASAVTLTQVTIADDSSLPFLIASGATCISGGQLAAGKSCTVPVVFAPTVAGANLGTLYISYLDTYDRAVTLASLLTGKGVTTAALTPASYNFGNVTVGTDSPNQAITLTNTGTVPLSIGGVSFSGPFPLAVGGNCGNTLAAGQSCIITGVVFQAGVAGPATGSISVVTGAGTLISTLIGTGVAPAKPTATLTPASYNFGNVTVGTDSPNQAITLTNTGTVPLSIGGASFSGPFPLAVGGNCGNTLAAGQSCVITGVVFQAGVAGPATGSISVVTGAGTLTSTLTGTGVAPAKPTATLTPASYNFGNVTVGTVSSKNQAITLTNTGTVPLSVGAVSTSGPFPLAVGGNCGNTLAAGQSCVITGVVFQAGVAGPATGSISVVTGAGTLTSTLTGTGVAPAKPTATLTPASYNFGNVTVGTVSSKNQAITLTNTGTVPLSVGAVSTSGPFPLAVGGNCGNTLAAGQSCVITGVVFQAGVAGPATGSISVVTGAGTLTSTLTGTGVAPAKPTATLTPASYNFGNVTVGTVSSKNQAITLTNTGTVPLSVGAVSTSGPFPLAVGGNCGNTLAAGQSCVITGVVFQAGVAGPATGSISVVTGAGTLTSTLTGTGVAPAKPIGTLTPASYNFGNVTVGTVSSMNQAITLTNTGTVPLSVGAVSTSGPFPLAVGGNCGNTLAAGQSCVITGVVFQAGVAGPATGSISVVTGAGTLTSTLTGTGVAPSATTPFIDFGTGFTADALTLTGPVNIAGGALQLTAGPSSAASSAFYPTPVPTASFTTDFTFQLLDPTAEGITFTIQGDGPNAVGLGGGGLGYQGLAKSIAVKFDLKDTAGEGVDSTGIYVDGAAPTVPAVSLASSGIDLHSGDTFDLRLTYDGTTMTINLTDTVTNATWSTQAAEDIPGITGGSTAYFGFTAGSGTPTLSADAAESERAESVRPAAISSAAAQPPATSNILTWIYVANGAVKSSQTINFSALAAKTYGVAPIQLAATATSGLPVSYSVTGPAKLSGVTLTLTGAGDVSVTATQSGNASFTAAVPVTRSFAVVKAPLTVTANSVTRDFGAANPALTYKLSGFVDGDTATVVGGTAVLKTTAVPASPAGEYPITFSTEGLAAANYSFAYVAGTLTVTSAASCHNVKYASGFTASGLSLNGGATISDTALELTDGGLFEARSAFFSTPLPTTRFTTDFTFQITEPAADGMTFIIQSNNPRVVGQSGGGLGYAGIPHSVAIKVDLHNNAGEGTDSTGTYIDGSFPSIPAINLAPAGIDLHSGHIFAVHLSYANGLTMGTIKDTVTGVSASMNFPGDITQVVGNSAWFGFTAGSGAHSATQKILTWSYSGGTGCLAK